MTVTDEERAVADMLAHQICGCATDSQHRADVAALLAYRQAAYAAGLERAAVIAEESMVLLSLGSPEDGPFTRQDKAVDEARACIATAIRAEKDKTNGPL